MRAAFALLLVGCSSIGAAQAPVVEPFPESTLVAEARIRDAVAAAAVDIGEGRSRIVLLERADGRQLRVEVGAPTEPFITSSTAKPAASILALDLVDRGLLSLDTRVVDVLPGYIGPGEHDRTTVRDLMRFTAPVTTGPLCERSADWAAFVACVEALPSDPSNPGTSNTDHRYAGQQLNVLSAVIATAAGLPDYRAAFEEWSTRTGHLLGAGWSPGSSIPSGAISLEVTAAQYVDLLRALRDCTLFTGPQAPRLCAQMQQDQIPHWTSPTRAERTFGEDWHFGFGCWIECREPTFRCPRPDIVATYGRAGQYGLIDRAHGVIGYVSPTLGPDAETNGHRLYRAIEPMVLDWARLGAP